MSRNIKGVFKGAFLSLVLAAAMLAPTAAWADDSWMLEEAQLWHITDEADILTDEEDQALEEQAQAIEDEYGFGVYIIAVNDYGDYFEGDVFDAARTFYKDYSLGVGEEKDGLLLLLSMSERDYSLVTYGDTGTYAFNDEGRALLTDFFLDDFAEDDWYTGFEDFLTWCPSYLETAAAGEPYSDSHIPLSRDDALFTLALYVLAIILIPLIIMIVVVKRMDAKMKSVAAAAEASHYVTGSLQLTRQYDSFSHVTETVTQKASSGSKSSSSHSGGFSGTSGKF